MIPGSATPHLIGASAAASSYQISRSLRLNSADSAALSRTVASAGNRQTWTWAGWVKRTAFGAISPLFSSGSAANNNLRLQFLASPADTLAVTNEVSGTATSFRVTSAVYRDCSAWMHVVLAVDTTLATAANRIELYVNGVEITQFQTSSDPTTSLQLQANNAGTHYIGRNFAGNYFNGYLADVYFIDGQALTPSSFGEFDANNVWQPKAYTGTFGSNGFELDFSDNSAATATTLGADRSGNGNNFTPANLSVTAGIGNDSLVDTPTNYGTETGVGGEVRGNYCTLNPLSTVTTATPANGNLEFTTATAGHIAIGSIGMSSGKWYWEVRTSAGTTQARAGVYNTAASAFYSLAANNTDYGIRFDADTGTIDFTTNGTSWSLLETGLTSGPYFPYFQNNGTTSKTITVNFGQRPFTYTAPSGYKCLCSTNLPTPTIANGATAMNTVLYTGTGATLTPTSALAFSPDLVWIKSRSAATDHALYDTIRGAQVRLESNTTDGDATSDNGLTAFNAAGFTLGTLAQVNTLNATYAAWCWDAGTSTVTNTAGSITSQVRANVSAGISVVTYTGNNTQGATVGHGLGVAPQLVISKNRSVAANWQVNTTAIDGSNDVFFLNLTDAKTDSTIAAPTSTVVSRSAGLIDNGNSSNNHVMYCFAPVAGFSAFGSYVGNGSTTSGPFIYTGFRPRWIVTKRTDAVGNWILRDSSRLGYNANNDYLLTNANASDSATSISDILSNGFKLRDSFNNSSGATYFYAAFAEHPFSLARAR